MQIKNNKLRRGFTLIELLIVIGIISLLSSFLLASMSSARTKGKDAARIEDVKSLKTALELYYHENGGYPTYGSSSGVLLSDSTLVGKLVPKYISSMPAILIADGDQYYALGTTGGVQTAGFDLLVYIGITDSQCRAGTVPGSTTNWGVPAVCKF